MIRQVSVPWIPGYDVGVGADLASGSPMGHVVKGEATPVEDAAGATVKTELQRIQSTEDLEQALGIDVEASYGCAAFAGASARFSFAKNSKVHSSSLFLAVTVCVDLEFLSVDDPVLDDHAAEVINLPHVFTPRYGNMFVRGIGRGGLFVGVFRVDTSSSEETTNISAELEGSYGAFSAEAEVNFRDVMKKYRSEVFVQMYHEGGPVDLKINNPSEPEELLRNSHLFLDSFAQRPDKVARPYYVTLAPITIARGPLPPNDADLQHAQDIIVYCAKRRSALLDQLNLVDYIAANPTKYDFSNGADPAAVRKSSADFQTDLDTVAACASAAMNDPAKAKMPAEFAAAKGAAFPVGALPDPLPVGSSTGKTVMVPDFRACKTWSACLKLADEHGLKLTYDYEGDKPEPFRVIDFRPPKDTEQPVGSFVTIVCPPDPPMRFEYVPKKWSEHPRPWTVRLIDNN